MNEINLSNNNEKLRFDNYKEAFPVFSSFWSRLKKTSNVSNKSVAAGIFQTEQRRFFGGRPVQYHRQSYHGGPYPVISDVRGGVMQTAVMCVRRFPSPGERSGRLTSSPSPGLQSFKHKSIVLITVWTMSKWDILARSDIKRYSLAGSLTHGEKIPWIVCFGLNLLVTGFLESPADLLTEASL